MLRLNIVMVCFVVITAAGCTSSDDAAPSCIENETQSCLCLGGAEGVQACDGSGAWSACDCTPADPSCAENETQSCLCLGGAEGVQICDGSGAWSACDCTPADPSCVENETQPCLCSGGVEGVQTCDGSGAWSACDCGTHCATGLEYTGSGCVDIDECATGLAACAPNATCINSIGGYGCACNDGFSGDGMTCVDDDECALGLDDCDANATCTNTIGGYTCACNAGYMGDGSTCALLDEMVADVSSNPIQVVIAGVGTFDIDGLSRIGWSFDIIETPLPGGRTHKELGLVHYPDITMRGLRGSADDVSNLVTWSNAGVGGAAPHQITVTLVGLGGESITVNLRGALPISADTTVTADVSGDRMAELVFGLGYGVAPGLPLIAKVSYVQPYGGAYPQYPAPGQLLQIDGVTWAPEEPGWPMGELDIPALDSSDPLYLPNVPRAGLIIFEWMYSVTEGYLDPRTCSVIDYNLNGPGSGEIYRVNIFNAFPARLNVFNPLKPYGTTYLLDLLIVDDMVEEA